MMKPGNFVWLKRRLRDREGVAAVIVLVLGILIAGGILAAQFWGPEHNHARFALAQSTATTTVTILNTPPIWSVDAQESSESSTSTPTNAGSPITWVGTASDPNSDSYYLLICKSSSTPTAGVGGGAPTCGGGAGNQWAVSALTASASQASSTYTTSSTDPQSNPWFAWICDNNGGGAQCNATFKQGTGNTASPFIVNHRPTFSSFTNNSPTAPGGTVTWSTNASDTDNFTGATDTVVLYVCKANDFTGSACGSGGTYCSSTASLANPTCGSSVPIPKPDQGYSSFGFVVDQHIFAASGGSEGSNSTYTISNVAPSISSSSISLLNSDGSSTPLTLTVPAGQTSGFQVKFTVSDNNSCVNAASTSEVTAAIINVYRSGVGQASCQTSGNYNANNCYPAAIGTSTWGYSCSQDAGSCSGSSTLTATWTCTFPLWYLADPTDGSLASDTQFFAENWLVSVRATDDNGATSTLTEGSTGNEVASFLSTQLNSPTINFGALSPGSSTPTLSTSTSLTANGNVGVDEKLYGADLCPTYPSCPVSTTSTIPAGQIQYATSTVAYGAGFALPTSSPATAFPIHIAKSTATSTPTNGSTFWGISVPSTIQLSGAYTGQNTFVGVKSPAQSW